MAVDTQITITTAEPGPATTLTESSSLFVVDANPSTSQNRVLAPAYDVHPHTVSLGESANVKVEAEPDSEDDVIVYDAPNPRISTPRVELTMLTNVSVPNHTPSSTPRQINPLRKGKFVHVVGRNAKRSSGGILGVKRKKLAEHGNFASFGAMIAEARLRSQDEKKDKDPKEHLRRQGDSDVDWGDETDESEGGPAAATAEGMDLDPDLVGSGVTTTAMESFVKGIDANHVTMDDMEDPDIEEYSSSDEMHEDEDGTDDEDVEVDEEMMMIEEFLAAQDGSDFSDEEDELDPRAGFQARLDRLRKKQQKMIEMEDGEDEDEVDPDLEWAEIDVRAIYVPESRNSHNTPRIVLKKPSVNTRGTWWHVTRSLGPSRMGFSKTPSPKLPPRVSPSVKLIVLSPTYDFAERKDLPVELQDLWEKDRLKKAKRKDERELARLEAALDPLVAKKGGKKSKKAMITAARLDSSIEISHQIVDMVSVEQQIRRFLVDKDNRALALPACGRSTRKKIHNLAALFGLNSKSKDGALGRYTTLTKRNYSGKNIDEKKVARMMEGFKYRAWYDGSEDDWDDDWNDRRQGKGKGKGKGKHKGKDKGKGKSKEKDQSGHLKTKEGEVVGHVCARCFIKSDSPGFLLTNCLFF